MRITILGLAIVAVLSCACQPAGNPSQSTQQAAPRCVGGAPSGFDAVVAGTDNQFFTATSRQGIKIKPGVEVKTELGPDGKAASLTLSRDNNQSSISCQCPAGCSRDDGSVLEIGCIQVVEEGPGGRAHCEGDCFKGESCCTGCGWVSARR
jgi:hypothetical protein